MSANVCQRCHVFFVPSASDPAVSAASLGVGIYHYACARLKWRDKADKVARLTTARLDKRRLHGKKLAQWRAEMDAKIAAQEAAEANA